MDSQLALYLPAPRARRRDPATSHRAAKSMRKQAPKQADRVLEALWFLGEAGANQIAAVCGLTQVQVCRRLPELEAAGKCAPTDRTCDTASGRPERVWRAVL
jgi:predicted ArsR family transcriptional regulator